MVKQKVAVRSNSQDAMICLQPSTNLHGFPRTGLLNRNNLRLARQPPEQVLLVQSLATHIGEYLRMAAEDGNEIRRKDREFMGLPGQEHAR